ncbi:MAG TPA: S9 family peptidase [Polyangia bacterium]|nr:S9 family peptidase [Polyangia bacterium]
MRTILLTLAVLSSAALAKAPPPRAPKAPVPLEEYFKIRRVGSRSGILLSFSHDEKLVAYLSDEGGRSDIWVQPVAGGAATQITHVKGFIQGLAFSPAADQLAFTSDTGGDELPHLFLTDSKGTAPRDLSAGQPAGRRTDFVEWADDGKTFLYLSSARDEKYMDLYEYDVASGKSTRLWEASGKLGFGGASRDHKHFIVSETLSDSNGNLYLGERGQSGKPQLLTPHQGEALFGAADFSRDGKTLYYTTDEGREFTALYALDLARHASKPVLQPDWDVEGAGFSHAWKYFFAVVNADGQTKLEWTDAPGGKAVALPPPPPGGAWVPLTSSPTDRYLGVRLQGDGAPAAPYVIDLQSGSARRLIDPLPASLRSRKMIVGEVVHIPSFDGKTVPALLYKPEGAGRFPAVIDVHGGPTSQSRREFSGIRQYLLSKGFVVLVPNVRGSTGYGKSYTRLDNHDLGGGPLKDVIACKSWLAKEANVDANKVVVMGGSYGGYMALAAATFAPTEFAALVDYFGVSDLKTLVESFPPYWAAEAEFIYKKFGNPKDPADAQYQHDRSPIHFVDKIVRPLLVVQGDRDARVKKDQSDRVVAALKQRKVPVHYLVLTDEGHGFSRNESILAAYRLTDRFLDRYLFGDNTVEVDQRAP